MISLSTVGAWALRHIPLRAWIALALVAACGASLWLGISWWEARLRTEFERGRVHERQVTALDSIMRARIAEQRRRAEQHTDSMVAVVRTAPARVQRAVAALPPAVMTLPAVQDLVTVAITTAQEAVTLSDAAIAERAMHRMQQQADSAEIVRLRVVVAVQDSTIDTLSRRPTWRQLTLAALLGGLAGALGGATR